jgi:hypothetical protein
VAVAEAKLARGEHLPELRLKGPIEDFLPEPGDKILARLAALPEAERDQIIGLIALLIDLDAPRLKLSAAQIRTLDATPNRASDILRNDACVLSIAGEPGT